MTEPYAEVIGDPISHSKSPIIHNFWLTKCGISAEYRTCHVRPTQLESYLAARREDPAWRGCNVTLPHKIMVMDHVGDPGNVRASIGAMNTLLPRRGALIGTNTDAGGFFMPLAEIPLEGATVVVIGTGGAAHAVLFALARCGVVDVTLLARNVFKGAALLARFGLKGRALPLGTGIPAAQLLVNTTSLGMLGQPNLVIDLAPLPNDAIVYDIVYQPLITPLLAAAERRGLTIIDGLEMLVGQAAAAFELFFDQSAPRAYDEELRALLTR